MRIIGGKFKGRTLISPQGNAVRPTTDRIKEAIFNLVQNEVLGAKVLDLFSGSGAIGIEALSRGAKSVDFVDNAKISIDALSKNLEKVQGEVSVVFRDYRSALSDFALRGHEYDLIFLDPPYNKNIESDALKIISDKNILSANGTIILERDRGAEAFILPKNLAEVDSRDYGGTTIKLIKRATKCALTGTFDPFTSGHFYLLEKALREYDICYIALLNNPDKEPLFPIDKRVAIIEKSVKEFKKRVKIIPFSGTAIDFCTENGIEYIVRGVRDKKDTAYENEMAEYNLKNGGINTIIFEANEASVSSSLVREKLKEGKDISGLVCDGAKKEILNGVRKWKI
ncbi:MAG: 16S rRNA (guanine(966)-N(2))-methyltransferase RsmD [Firmicutes bacterium]|nr:16S rRNA (guanine(966)-N(2))-methyltransferase RsmD [Bacillota bacterium]